MTVREKYERAKGKRERYSNRIKGGLTESQEAELMSLTREMLKWRDKLIAAGEWDQPIPIRLKAKYRGN